MILAFLLSFCTKNPSKHKTTLKTPPFKHFRRRFVHRNQVSDFSVKYRENENVHTCLRWWAEPPCPGKRHWAIFPQIRSNSRDFTESEFIDFLFTFDNSTWILLFQNGFCFVDFDDYRDADDAVYEMNGRDLLGDRYLCLDFENQCVLKADY